MPDNTSVGLATFFQERNIINPIRKIIYLNHCYLWLFTTALNNKKNNFLINFINVIKSLNQLRRCSLLIFSSCNIHNLLLSINLCQINMKIRQISTVHIL